MASLEYTAIQNLLSSMEKEMKGIIQSRNMSASGEAESLIEFRVSENAGGAKGILYGPDYIEFMERGRGPGKFPPLGVIEKWIEAKGIQADISNKSLAFLIGRKIAEEGSVLHRSGQRSGILSKVITPERISTFTRDYTNTRTTRIKKELSKLIKI